MTEDLLKGGAGFTVKIGNPMANDPLRQSVAGQLQAAASSRGFLGPLSVTREHAQDDELETLYNLLRDTAEYLEAIQLDGSLQPDSSSGSNFRVGIPVSNFLAAMRHLGLVLTESEVKDMFSSADNSTSEDGDSQLQLDEFLEMTADAQRDIHDGDHARSPTLLWRLTYARLKIVQDARLMRQKVLGLKSLFGLEQPFSKIGTQEGMQVAAQLVYDAVTNRNIYHKLNAAGRSSYLLLHRLRHVFAAAVWMHLAVGWVEDNSNQDHEWFSSLHVDEPYYFVVPALEVCLLTPIHLYHCHLRKASSVHWKGDWWLLGKLFCVAFIVCDAAHEMVGGMNTAPISRIARPYLLLDLYSTVRKLHQQCFAALASLKELMLLALVCLFFFVLAGMMMYPSASDNVTVDANGNIHAGDEGFRGSSQGNTAFTDLWTRVANLVYLTFGAVNYPDIMLPSYIEDGSAALAYFIPAIVVFLFLFLNIVLAVVYNGYTSDRDEQMVKETAKRCVALTLAFRAIAQGGTEITKDDFERFVREYRKVENNYTLLSTSNVRAEELEQLWMELQPQKREGREAIIGPYEFLQLPGLLAARRFREGPQWALRDANTELTRVDRIDVRLNEGAHHREITTSDMSQSLVGKPVTIVRVRGYMGGDKILTRKLLKQRSVAHFHADAAPSSPSTHAGKKHHWSRGSSSDRKEARKTCWVGRIPKGTTEQQLQTEFNKYGTVVLVTLREKELGSWAFVKYGRSSGVDAAVAGGAAIEGTDLQVEKVDVKALEEMRTTQDGAAQQSGAKKVWDVHNDFKLDWSDGVPLVWRRATEIHETAELVTFTGKVTHVDPENDCLNINCDFEEDGGVPRTTCDRFLRGGLHPPLRGFLLRRDVNALIIWVILVSLVFTFYQYLYRNEHTREEQANWHAVDYCITFFFVSELIAKIIGFGFIGYWNSTWHRIDLLITTATVISTASLALPTYRSNVPGHRYSMLFKLMSAFRVFRLLRLLSAWQMRKGAMDNYHLIFTVTTNAAGAMRDFFFYVIVVFYIYSIWGIYCFGGDNGLTRDHPKSCIESAGMRNPVLEGTGYDGASYTSIGLCFDDVNATDNWGAGKENSVSSYYYGMNFDDMSNAFVTLLHMLIMNNWHVTHEACVAVFEDNAKLCIDLGANNTMAYAACDMVHSRWVVSAYFYSFEFYVALVLVNILMSFFLDIYSFVWDKYTEHFQESRHENAHRNIMTMVDRLASVARDAGIEMEGHDHKLTGDAGDGSRPLNCCSAGAQTCAGCLLAEPNVRDVHSTHVPLFVPSYGMFAQPAAFDAVNLCQACRRYWSAIEMLTTQHGTISGLDKGIAEAMSQDEIQEQQEDMELKVRIMLKLGEVDGYGDSLGLTVVPIRPGAGD